MFVVLPWQFLWFFGNLLAGLREELIFILNGSQLLPLFCFVVASGGWLKMKELCLENSVQLSPKRQ